MVMVKQGHQPLGKRYKAVVVISPRLDIPGARLTYTETCLRSNTHQTYQQQVLNCEQV
jgi:hypothetical protein